MLSLGTVFKSPDCSVLLFHFHDPVDSPSMLSFVFPFCPFFHGNSTKGHTGPLIFNGLDLSGHGSRRKLDSMEQDLPSQA